MPLPFRAKKKPHRRAGDVHRNARDWDAAAAAYRRHLADYPDDDQIWVQLAHVEKERGAVDEAVAAYTHAATIAPHDPDPRLHLAHLLKTEKRFEAAAQAFLDLYERDPSPGNLIELRRITALRPNMRTVIAARGAILFAVQDMFAMFAHHTTMTGIQRVQAGVALAAMADPSFDAHFIINDVTHDDTPASLRLAEDDLKAIIAYSTGSFVDPVRLRQLLEVARIRAMPITFGAGTAVVILGSFWGIGNGIDQYLAPRRAGARVVPMIYDIIPISHPQFCDANLTNFFWRGFAELAFAADAMMAISEFTRAEVERFIANHGGRPVPVEVVPLAHSIAPPGASSPMLPTALIRLQRPFVAYVSTVEGRKNHLFVVRAWQEMIARGVDVPDLVFVGREGWRVEPLMKLLADTDHLGGRVHIVAGLSDAELDAVYSRAMFTVFTSIVEGWGLPVGESLARGTPCVVTRTASLPEVGGTFADYVDPDDLPDAVAVFRRLIEDPAYLAERRRNIQQHFIARNWNDVGRDFIAKLRALLAALPPVRPLPPVTLPTGTVFRPGAITRRIEPLPGYLANPLGLPLIDGFYEPEPWGAWLRGDAGEITFRVALPAGTRLFVYLSLRAAPWAVGGACTATMDGRRGPRSTFVLGAAANRVRLEGFASASGNCTITLRYAGASRPLPGDGSIDPDLRRFALGLEAIAIAPADDIAGRAMVREELLFG